MTPASEPVGGRPGGDGAPEAALVAARAAGEKLGERTVVLAVGELLGVTDAFVITSGRNSRQVRTIAEEVERVVEEECGRSPWAVEGRRELRWVLLDYGDFLVHVFHEEDRGYYELERLWADAVRVPWEEALAR